MRALVLTTSWPMVSGNTSGSFVRDLLRGLVTSGWTFEVVTPALADRREPLATERGIEVHPAPYWGGTWNGGLAHRRGLPETLASEPWKWALVPGLWLAMERAARRRIEHAGRCGPRFDALWSHWLFPSGVLGARLARAHGLPHVVTAHGADVHRLERLTRIPMARETCTRIWSRTRITAPAELTAGRVSRALAGRTVEVCPLPAFADRAAGEERDPRRAPRLLYLGRLEPIKGPDRLLDACERVSRGTIERVTLAGAGSLEPSLRARAAALAHPVDFTGVLEGEAKRAAVRCADFMVLPSRRLGDGRTEGFPHAAMEALAAGTPVIAPRGGALGEWIDRTGAGETFEDAGRDPQCAERLGRLIESLARSPGRRAELAARVRSAGTVFAPANAIASWCRVLADAKRGIP